MRRIGRATAFLFLAGLQPAACRDAASSGARPQDAGPDAPSATDAPSDQGSEHPPPSADSGVTRDAAASAESGVPTMRSEAGADASVVATKTCPSVPPGSYQHDGLPPTTPVPAGLSALTNWSQHPTSGGWYSSQTMDACRYEEDPTGFRTWHGMPAARVEVQPGDDPLMLGENTERAEMLTAQTAAGAPITEDATSGTQYYATSYYFPATWAATFYPYSAFEASGTSWPAGTTSDCTSGSGNACNSWSFVMQFYPWAALAAASPGPGMPQTMWFSGSQMYAFADGGLITLGQWSDLVIEVQWATGGVTIWRRGQGASPFTQVVEVTDPKATQEGAGGIYMKQGLYRGGTVNGRTDVLWVGPTARGATFAAVEQAAFGTSDGP